MPATITRGLDWIQLTVEFKYKPPEGWLWFKSEVIGSRGHYLITGGVPRPRKSGKNKGAPTWRDAKLDDYVITHGDVKDAEVDYEKRTGNCAKCFGTAKFCSKDCKTCLATGKSAQV